jgi:Tfp pilus assembly protein PilF
VMLQDAAAKAACDHALTLDDQDAATWEHRGIARYLAGDDRGALEDLDRALALDPKSGEAFLNRAMVRTHAGVAGARDDLTRACELDVREACGALRSGSTPTTPLVP